MYIDDIFMTSNESFVDLNQLLDEANGLHPNIKLVRQIGKSVPFLDVLVENQNGMLTTSVYHKTAAEPYIVPFSSDHPRHIFANIIDTQLLRAIRYSSTLLAFNHERCSIHLLLLYNGYVSSAKIITQWKPDLFIPIDIHPDILTNTYGNSSRNVSYSHPIRLSQSFTMKTVTMRIDPTYFRDQRLWNNRCYDELRV
jgi:hypothetical protein